MKKNETANGAAAINSAKEINNLVEKYHLVFNKKTNLYDCNRSVKVERDLISDDGELLVRFGVVKGNFIVNMVFNPLVSLEGVPQKVGKDFILDNVDRLTSLVGSPKEVGRDFIVRKCDSLKSLEGAPQKVGKDFYCWRCGRLQSLEGAPQEVAGTFECYNCDKLKSLNGAPQKVGGNFNCSCCFSLKSLEGAPKEVEGTFDCTNCDKLKSLEGAPQRVGGNFNCSSCSLIKSLEGAPQRVGGYFDCSRCSSLNSLEGAPKEIGGLFYCYNCNSLKSLNGVPREVLSGIDISECENIELSDGIPCDMGGNNNRSNQTNDEQTNVQEKERHTCCICGKEFEGYGNNASPVMDNGCCCDECNRNVVKPARILSEAHSIQENSRLKETDVEKVMVYPAKDVLTEDESNSCYKDSSCTYNACFNTLVREGTTYVEGYIPYDGGRLMLPFAVNKTSDGKYFDSSLAKGEPFEFYVKREYTKEEIFNIHGTARMSFLTIGDDWKILQPSSTCNQMRKVS